MIVLKEKNKRKAEHNFLIDTWVSRMLMHNSRRYVIKFLTIIMGDKKRAINYVKDFVKVRSIRSIRKKQGYGGMILEDEYD